MSTVLIRHKPVLKKRVITAYVFSVLIPILLLSTILFFHINSSLLKKHIEERKHALLIEQNYLNNQFESAHTYSNQLLSNYDFMSIINGFSYSKKHIIYNYQKQVYSLLSGIILYDDNIEDIFIFTKNRNAVDILPSFYSMDNFFENIGYDKEMLPVDIISGFWRFTEIKNEPKLIFTKQIFNPKTASVEGYLELVYNNNIINNYVSIASGNEINTATYILYKNDVIFSHPDDNLSLDRYKHLFHHFPIEGTMPELQPVDSGRTIMTCIYPDVSETRIIKVSEVGWDRVSIQPIVLISTLVICTILLSSIIIHRLIYRPFSNIMKLSEHMGNNTTHRLVPFEGSVSNDETGDLINAYNDMSLRINTLSENLLNSELQLKNAQIEALHSQLNPHFFYGTLETIRMIAETNQQALIADISFSFGNLMRYSLSREYLVDIQKEIDVSKRYLAIQEKRMNNRFSVSWNIHLDTKHDILRQWRCPKFVLFSLIENVFSHNISKTRKLILITISITTQNNSLYVSVSNTGPGISKQRLDELRFLIEHTSARGTMTSDKNGRSLFNIYDRLKLFYGENYDFTLESDAGIKTTISIRIPDKFVGFT